MILQSLQGGSQRETSLKEPHSWKENDQESMEQQHIAVDGSGRDGSEVI